jgi:hypothetical protein
MNNWGCLPRLMEQAAHVSRSIVCGGWIFQLEKTENRIPSGHLVPSLSRSRVQIRFVYRRDKSEVSHLGRWQERPGFSLTQNQFS